MRRLLGLLVVVLMGWLTLWGLASLALPKVVDAVLGYAIPTMQRAGIAIDSLDFRDIRVAPSLVRASASDVAAAFDLTPTDDIAPRSTFEAQEVSVRLTNPISMRGDLSIEGFEVSFHETDRPRGLFFDRLTNAYVHIDDLPLLSPREAMLEIYTGLEELFIDNARVGNFEFRGQVLIRVQDLTLPAQLYTERQGDHHRLRFSRDDVRALAAGANVELSEGQIEIVSLFPIRVPFLIRATRRARSLARESFPSDLWLRDALRHISWSYLLTQEFGSEFAREVTDAQETRPGNTPDERSMDFHNNAVGRQFASNGTPLADLPRLVRSHPDIIRHPDEVASRSELLR